MNKLKRILITGSAGFIGHHLLLALSELPVTIVGLDSVNDYYDPQLKAGRLHLQGFDLDLIKYNTLTVSQGKANISFIKLDLTDEPALTTLFQEQDFDVVIHLAAQAGVRHSLKDPKSYVASNLVGFANILECCRHFKIKHLLFASSSSVYGNNQKIPFSVQDRTDTPVSFYAATKKANEVMAHSYAHLYQLPITGMRFFTVYGPWGRPDMAYFSFAKAIQEQTPIKIYNHGNMLRDFTYVDDVIQSIIRLVDLPPKAEEGRVVPYKLFNIGNSQPEHLMELVTILERLLQKKAILDLQPMPPGDVPATFADVQDLIDATDFRPLTSLETGLTHFIKWYTSYYQKQFLTVS
ncbi:NAD-dependent epimerase/dehydratase family protein [Adhaeribacter radiodurans]|uniref:NAD-dependent epimerase/dehydratase family protein n=1 Tax=Adhaeribacter radiodurans TaxID=2745197 RepID=A0A7L7L6Y5_9BACT|nr:NAD-dependent epimerase/dehydratase family protein [Adhaeribacter radiodurans]QMU28596.1 NAD-dependent epimerase/dehydratase family protein [Adhaeribacter radiodurans]